MVPAVNQAQLGLLRVHSFLGYTNLILKERSGDATLNTVIVLVTRNCYIKITFLSGQIKAIANLFYFLLTAFACAAV